MIDVGCNIGNRSSLLKLVGNLDAYILIDPVKKNLDLAIRNNPQAQAYLAAAGETGGKTSCITYNDNLGAGTVRDLWNQDPGWGVDSSVISVDMISIDLIHQQNVRALKIDAEGSELRLLKGAQATIRRYKPIIWVEMHSDEILDRSFEYSRRDIINFLIECGYSRCESEPALGGMNFLFF